jgi:hypothetical protein
MAKEGPPSSEAKEGGRSSEAKEGGRSSEAKEDPSFPRPAPTAPGCAHLDFASPATHALLAAAPRSGPGRNLFFIRTSNETALAGKHLCGVASAILKNPTFRVYVFSNHLQCSQLPAPFQSPRVRIVRFDAAAVFAPYPRGLLAWFLEGSWRGQFELNNLGNAMRLALMHRFGGVYMDSDVLSLRPFDEEDGAAAPAEREEEDGAAGAQVDLRPFVARRALTNMLALEDDLSINNAVLAFEAGHPFLRLAMDNFAQYFKKKWAWNGPRLMNRIWHGFTTERFGPVAAGVAEQVRHESVALLSPQDYYAVPWPVSSLLNQPLGVAPGVVSDTLQQSRLAHLWNSLKDKSKNVEGKGLRGLDEAGSLAGLVQWEQRKRAVQRFNAFMKNTKAAGFRGGSSKQQQEEWMDLLRTQSIASTYSLSEATKKRWTLNDWFRALSCPSIVAAEEPPLVLPKAEVKLPTINPLSASTPLVADASAACYASQPLQHCADFHWVPAMGHRWPVGPLPLTRAANTSTSASAGGAEMPAMLCGTKIVLPHASLVSTAALYAYYLSIKKHQEVSKEAESSAFKVGYTFAGWIRGSDDNGLAGECSKSNAEFISPDDVSLPASNPKEDSSRRQRRMTLRWGSHGEARAEVNAQTTVGAKGGLGEISEGPMTSGTWRHVAVVHTVHISPTNALPVSSPQKLPITVSESIGLYLDGIQTKAPKSSGANTKKPAKSKQEKLVGIDNLREYLEEFIATHIEVRATPSGDGSSTRHEMLSWAVYPEALTKSQIRSLRNRQVGYINAAEARQ